MDMQGPRGPGAGCGQQAEHRLGDRGAASPAGARVAFTYQGERLEKNVRELAEQLDPEALVMPCDVTRDEDIQAAVAGVGERYGRLDAVVHAVAFAPPRISRGALPGHVPCRLRHSSGRERLFPHRALRGRPSPIWRRRGQPAHPHLLRWRRRWSSAIR